MASLPCLPYLLSQECKTVLWIAVPHYEAAKNHFIYFPALPYYSESDNYRSQLSPQLPKNPSPARNQTVDAKNDRVPILPSTNQQTSQPTPATN